MHYQVSDILINTIGDKKRRLITHFFFMIVAVMAGSVKIYYIDGRIDPLFIFAELLLLGLCTFFEYDQVVKPGKIVSRTALSVIISDEEIIIGTIPFKVLFWINKPSRDLVFKIHELNIKFASNPLKPYFDLDSEIFQLKDKEKEAFIIYDYFDNQLKEKLTETLVEVTPPNLLIRGRLRHR